MGKKAKSVVIFFVLLLIDQLTKLWAVKILKPIGSIKIIHNVLCGEQGSGFWHYAE